MILAETIVTDGERAMSDPTAPDDRHAKLQQALFLVLILALALAPLCYMVVRR